MKPIILTCAMMVYTTLMCAQNEQKAKATVHMKKVELVNGVEKITDTTYTTDDMASFTINEGDVHTQTIDRVKSGRQKVVVINAEGKARNGEELKDILIEVPELAGPEKMTVMRLDEEAMSAEDKKRLDEKLRSLGIDPDKAAPVEGKTVIIKTPGSCSATASDLKKTEEIRITIIRNVNLSDASAAELEQLGRSAGTTDGKLSVEKMDFYPNPNNGHFNLSFTLPNKGNTDVKVMDLKGQVVFSETLNDFSGNYSKEIDISNNPKGVYFVRVEQGKHALVKKVVVD